MTTGEGARLERIRRLFDDVVDMQTGERAAFLATAGETDRGILAEVEELVAASRTAPEFLDRPAAESELEGQMAGPWRIETLLASGGMADVYHAVRADVDVDWNAAIKVLKPGLDGELVSRRLRSEQRVLAALSHPNIVVLLDAGTIADGRLYLAMELIDGLPIGRYCTERGLGIRERLSLFLQVCAAVQHAHQRFVVHCDLKPSNVLVTHEGVPKLLDFGIATLLAPAGRPGDTPSPITLAYASPEQLRGDVVSATTDVFSLGVMLYELVAGRRPFDVAGLTLEEALAKRSTRPVPLAFRDLDAVVMKALDGDADRRYPSVEQFAADIRRWLDHRPVAARRASLGLRIEKFVRRNRWATTGAALVVISLAIGAAGIYRGMLGAREEARLGWRAHTQAVQVSRFLEDMIGDLDPPPSGDPGGREAVLDRAAAKVDLSFAAYPETEGRLRVAIAKLYLDIDRPETAASHLRKAIAIMRAHRGFGPGDRARAEDVLARAAASAATRPSSAR